MANSQLGSTPGGVEIATSPSSGGGGGSGITQLTGDVTAGPGSGSQSATIANDSVTNAKLANMAEARIKGRAAGAGTGDPQDLTVAQVLTILGLASQINGPSASPTLSFVVAGNTAGIRGYRLRFRLKSSAANQIYLEFNADAGTNYRNVAIGGNLTTGLFQAINEENYPVGIELSDAASGPKTWAGVVDILLPTSGQIRVVQYKRRHPSRRRLWVRSRRVRRVGQHSRRDDEHRYREHRHADRYRKLCEPGDHLVTDNYLTARYAL
jgi:hypothetical protein